MPESTAGASDDGVAPGFILGGEAAAVLGLFEGLREARLCCMVTDALI